MVSLSFVSSPQGHNAIVSSPPLPALPVSYLILACEMERCVLWLGGSYTCADLTGWYVCAVWPGPCPSQLFEHHFLPTFPTVGESI